jgi:hypothetical protein
MRLILLFLFILIIFFGIKIIMRENFDNNCYVTDDCIEREDTSIVLVNPELPECVGICINQHTYTNENIDNNSDLSLIGRIKNGHSQEDIIVSNCGQCISNFYQGLKNMKNVGDTD